MFDMNIGIIVSLIIFLITFILIVTEKVHRTTAALLGAMVMVSAGVALGFLNGFTPIQFIAESIDFGTIGLLLGMMIFVSIFSKTGIFEWVAKQSIIRSRGKVWRLVIILSLISAILSAFLANATIILLIAPLTIVVARHANINPVPLVISEAISSNIGGTATLVGDPPNIMIGSAVGFSFNDFLFNLAPITMLVLFVTLLFLLFYYRKEFGKTIKIENDLQIKSINGPLLAKSLAVFLFIVVLFVIHDSLHIDTAFVALFGAIILLFLSKLNPEEVMKEVEWSTLLFFAGLFVLVAGINYSGVISAVASEIVMFTGTGDAFNPYLTSTLVLWGSAAGSAIIDSVPVTATMIPILKSVGISALLSEPVLNNLFWALALAACLGGNATVIGTSANIVAAGILEHSGYRVSFIDWLKVGLPVAIIDMVICTVYIIVKLKWIGV